MSAQRMPTDRPFQSTGSPVSPRNIARLRGPDWTRGVRVAAFSGCQYQTTSSYGLRVHPGAQARAASAREATAFRAFRVSIGGRGV